jgi:hypothetical protein
MLTQRIDAALNAIAACKVRTPLLADCYRPGTPERIALEGLLVALETVDAALLRRDAQPPITTAFS